MVLEEWADAHNNYTKPFRPHTNGIVFYVRNRQRDLAKFMQIKLFKNKLSLTETNLTQPKTSVLNSRNLMVKQNDWPTQLDG